MKKNIEEEKLNLNINSDQKIDVLKDGTEILSDNFEEDNEIFEEEISDDDLRKIIEFATGRKDVSSEELERIKGDDYELERLIKITRIKSEKLIYRPKKNFGNSYKKKRNAKNRKAKKSRIINRKK